MSVADNLRKLREQATEGPWSRGEFTDIGDGEFIAAAGNLWPLLCDLVEAADDMGDWASPEIRRALSVLADATQENT